MSLNANKPASWNLNLNSLLAKKAKNDNPSLGAETGGNYPLTLTKKVYLDTQSSDNLAKEIRESVRIFRFPDSSRREAIL